ncbi:DUF4249 domain-containing protein [Flavobacterium sp.]|uniref:DUF4249 domain-containing protein n=1 Tax=Flavobacterium sp. TaxID=239 RepID=UPI00263A1350|nr:DUF4249 domain-containing protein [Flavobacterium sp.]
MKNINYIYYIFIAVITSSCIEQIPLKSNTFEDVIVIQATITNEMKFQEVRVQRTYKFENAVPVIENNATVFIIDEQGDEISFHQDDDIYKSDIEFQALPSKQYELHVITENGREYVSTKQILTTESPIQSINANAVTSQINGRGVEITVNSFDPSNTSKYYRYEYEETYKVIAPKWRVNNLYYNTTTLSFFVLPDRNINLRTCYGFQKSKKIIQTTTSGLNEDRVVDFPVHFVSNQNYRIKHRYSILVKQYVQNLEAYNFYKTLNTMSSEGNILSPSQPGFIVGNIKNIEDPNEKIIGFFEVSSVSSARLFFNYTDLFPGEELPPDFNECYPIEYDSDDGEDRDKLIKNLNRNNITLLEAAPPFYIMVPRECGDCTYIWSNIIPNYWTE